MGDGSTVAVPEFVNLIRQVNGINYTSEDDVYYDTALTTELWYATGYDGVHGTLYEPAGMDYDTEHANFLLTLAEAGMARYFYSID